MPRPSKPQSPSKGRSRTDTRADRLDFDDVMAALGEWLPQGWGASLQLEDPLTHTLEEVASTDSESGSEMLALAPMPEAYTEPPEPWLLDRLGFVHCRVFPLAGERPLGRLLLYAEASARRLDEHRVDGIRQLCAESSQALERTRAHLEDEKFSSRLRKITVAELAETYGEAFSRLVPDLRAVAVFGLQDDDLTLLDLRRNDGGRRAGYVHQTVPFEGSFLDRLQRGEAPARAVVEAETYRDSLEGELLGRLLERWPPPTVETIPLQPSGRLLGALTLFHVEDPGADETRTVIEHLARVLSLSLDRLRPERRQASSLLYLQELLRSSRGGLVPVLRTVVEEIVVFMGADAGILALVDTETGSLLLSEHTGYEQEAVLPETIPLDPDADERAAISAQVVRTGEPYVAADTRSSPIYLPADDTIRSEIAVPLQLHGETVGVALASSRTPGFFLAEDATRFQLFADQVAVAIDNARLLDSLRRQRETESIQRQRRSFGFHPSVHADDVEYHFGNLVGDPKGAMGGVFRMIDRVADRVDDTVLVWGETGTGKEMVSHALHNASPRRTRPLVATNFAALGGDPNLIQSELFGHEKGAFTGAVRRRRGCFEKADQSTLLIDELGDIVPSVQVKLLRVLGRSRRREFERLGGEESVRSDVRVLAATNKDLRREMVEGRFREDLYYRLSALVIRIPPLRERPEDIPLFLRHFLPRLGGGFEVRVARGVVHELQSYPWPGNVRQLESVLLRALVMFGGPGELTTDDVRQALALEETFDGGTAAPLDRLLPPASPEPDWFWTEVHDPWKARRLSPEAVRDLLARELETGAGFYSRVADRLGVARVDYQRFMDFLTNSGLKVDHRPFRTGRS